MDLEPGRKRLMAQSIRLKTCPACGRSTNPQNQACPFCGHSFVLTQQIPSQRPQPANPLPSPTPVAAYSLPPDAVPVLVYPRRYRWIHDEPDALYRYMRIGLGIVVRGVLLCATLWLINLFVLFAAFEFVEGPRKTTWRLIASCCLSAAGIMLALLVAGVAIGCILRLVRDALHFHHD